MTILQQTITIILCALGTMLTRFLPFLVFNPKKPTPKSEHELHQQHIAHRAARDGEQHLSLPQVQADRHGDGDELGQAVGKVQHVNIAQAVDDEDNFLIPTMICILVALTALRKPVEAKTQEAVK